MKASVRRQLASRKRRILRRIENQPGVERHQPMMAASNIHYEIADRTRAIAPEVSGPSTSWPRSSGWSTTSMRASTCSSGTCRTSEEPNDYPRHAGRSAHMGGLFMLCRGWYATTSARRTAMNSRSPTSRGPTRTAAIVAVGVAMLGMAAIFVPDTRSDIVAGVWMISPVVGLVMLIACPIAALEADPRRT